MPPMRILTRLRQDNLTVVPEEYVPAARLILSTDCGFGPRARPPHRLLQVCGDQSQRQHRPSRHRNPRHRPPLRLSLADV